MNKRRKKLLLVFVLLSVPVFAHADSAALAELAKPQSYETRRESSAKEDLTKNGDSRPIEPGQTLVLGDLEGPGVITHVWSTINSKDPFYPRSLVLRIYYDGMEKPSVEAPYGDFFGVGNGASAEMQSAAITTSAYGRARNCWWHMPFQKRAKVTITNESAEYRTDSFYYYLDWQKHASLPENTPYFHAQYAQAHPAQPGPYVVLDTQGRGHFAGVVYSALQTQVGWFGEGDDRFYIDGADRPQLSGTGTEDYFGDAWGFHEFTYPYHGVPMFEGYMPGDRVSAYRWHLADPITFTKSLRFEFEHFGSLFTESSQYIGQFYERPDWLTSVAFWYQSPAKQLDVPLPPIKERMPPYRVFKGIDLAYTAEPSAGVMKGKGEVTYLPSKPDARIAFEFTVDQPGTYRVRAMMGYAFVGGMYQPLVDGKAIGGPISFFIGDDDTRWVDFDRHKLETGMHTLSFEGRGLSPEQRPGTPELYALQLNALVLLRLEDLAGYMDATNKALAEKKK